MKITVQQRSFDFAVRIVRLYKYLVETKKEFILAKQVLRSGTAPGALVREAQNAVSTKDFLHKLGIAQQECDETVYWLQLLLASGILSRSQFESIHAESVELLKMIRSAILTTKAKMKGDFDHPTNKHRYI
jgi:four helix bundle protein